MFGRKGIVGFHGMLKLGGEDFQADQFLRTSTLSRLLNLERLSD